MVFIKSKISNIALRISGVNYIIREEGRLLTVNHFIERRASQQHKLKLTDKESEEIINYLSRCPNFIEIKKDCFISKSRLEEAHMSNDHHSEDRTLTAIFSSGKVVSFSDPIITQSELFSEIEDGDINI